MKNNNYKLCPGMLFLSTLLVLLSLSACNSGLFQPPRQPTPAPQSVGSVDAASYFPLTDGNGWVYQATASGGVAPARYVNHVRLASHLSAGGTASLPVSESNPAPAAPAVYHLQSTAQGIGRFDETNQGASSADTNCPLHTLERSTVLQGRHTFGQLQFAVHLAFVAEPVFGLCAGKFETNRPAALRLIDGGHAQIAVDGGGVDTFTAEQRSRCNGVAQIGHALSPARHTI